MLPLLPGRGQLSPAAPFHLEELLQDIHALEEELLTYERKDGVLSETFYESYSSGEEPPDDAWVLD